MKYKFTKISLATVFALFAYFQLNDPDPWLWGTIYGLLSITILMSSWLKLPKLIFWLAYLGLGLYSLILIPEIISWINQGMPSIVSEMKAESPHIEYTREFFGLIISIGAIYFVQYNNYEV